MTMPIDKLQRVGQIHPSTGDVSAKKISTQGPSFEDALKKIQGQDSHESLKASSTQALQGLKFSNHAIERMQTRGIHFSPDQMNRLEMGVQRASGKGSQNSLILVDDKAAIVSVKNNTIVTVIDKAQLKENVFTNIDSTVVM